MGVVTQAAMDISMGDMVATAEDTVAGMADTVAPSWWLRDQFTLLLDQLSCLNPIQFMAGALERVAATVDMVQVTRHTGLAHLTEPRSDTRHQASACTSADKR